MKAYFESHMSGEPTSMFVKKVKAQKRIDAGNIKWMEAKLLKLMTKRFDPLFTSHMSYLDAYHPKNSVAKRRDALMQAYSQSHMSGEQTAMFVKKVKGQKRIHVENAKWIEAKLAKLTRQRFDRLVTSLAEKKK